MPWCPKCKNEYVEGVTTCADCGCELVDSLEDIEREGLIFGDEEEMQALKDFLVCNGIDSARISYSAEDGQTEVLVSGEQKAKAARYLNAFLKEWNSKSGTMKADGCETPEEAAGETVGADGEQAAGARGDECAGKKSAGADQVYEAASQKAENFRSGAYTLIGAGVIGLALLVCVLAGVLPVRLYGPSRYLTAFVMGVLFLVFVVMGVLSLKSSRIFEGKAKEESALKEELRRWCRENLSAAGIDASIPDLPNAEEERYFKRTERMKRMISDKFLNLEPGYLENFVDEIYPEYFE